MSLHAAVIIAILIFLPSILGNKKYSIRGIHIEVFFDIKDWHWPKRKYPLFFPMRAETRRCYNEYEIAILPMILIGIETGTGRYCDGGKDCECIPDEN